MTVSQVIFGFLAPSAAGTAVGTAARPAVAGASSRLRKRIQQPSPEVSWKVPVESEVVKSEPAEAELVQAEFIEAVEGGKSVEPSGKSIRDDSPSVRIGPRIIANLVNSHLILCCCHLRLKRDRAVAPEIEFFARPHIANLRLGAIVDLRNLALSIFERRQT
jgi:hypothetical protein